MKVVDHRERVRTQFVDRAPQLAKRADQRLHGQHEHDDDGRQTIVTMTAARSVALISAQSITRLGRRGPQRRDGRPPLPKSSLAP